jgi:hypothetical protein
LKALSIDNGSSLEVPLPPSDVRFNEFNIIIPKLLTRITLLELDWPLRKSKAEDRPLVSKVV